MALWRGNGAGVARCLPNHTLNFAFRDIYRNTLLKNVDRNESFGKFLAGESTWVLSIYWFWKFLGTFVSGGLGGATTLFMLYPFDFARTRLALDVKKDGSRKYKGMVDCLKKIKASEGVASWYKWVFKKLKHYYFGLFQRIIISSSVCDSFSSNFLWNLRQYQNKCRRSKILKFRCMLGYCSNLNNNKRNGMLSFGYSTTQYDDAIG